MDECEPDKSAISGGDASADAEDLMNLIGETLHPKTETVTESNDGANSDIANSDIANSDIAAQAVQCEAVPCEISKETSCDTEAPANHDHALTVDIATDSTLNSPTDITNDSSVHENVDSQILRRKIDLLETALSSEKSLRAKTEAESADVRSKLSTAISERDAYIAQTRQLKEDHAVFAANGKAYYEKRLQEGASHLNQVVKQAQDRDQAIKNTLEKLKNEFGVKIADLQKKLDSAVREKDLMVVRYAEGETKVIKAEGDKEKIAKALADIAKDKDVLLGKVKTMRDEKVKMQQQMDAKVAEMANMQKEVDRATESLRQSEQKARWLQGKMASETEGFADTKVKVERLTNALKDAKEETAVSKKHFESIIREYQKKEEEKENEVEASEQEKEVKRIIDEQLIQDKARAELGFKTELEAAVKKNSEMATEANSLKTRLKRLEEEKLELVSQLNDCHQQLHGKKNDLTQLSGQLKAAQARIEESKKLVREKEEEVTRAGRRVEEVENTIKSMKEAYEESHVEVDNYSARNAELLSFTEKVSSKNTQLLSEVANLKSQLTVLSTEKEDACKVSKEAEEESKSLKTNLKTLEAKYGELKEFMDKDIASKTEMVASLQEQLEDEKNEIKVMKKKHAMAIKELSREIQGSAAKKFFEGGGSHGSGTSSEGATINANSRAGSMTSLDNIPGTNAASRGRNPSQKSQPLTDHNHTHHMNGHSQMAVSVDGYHGSDSHQGMPEPGLVGGYNAYPEIAVVDIDKQKLVEKIVKLQKAHARKNEKMELMEEQIKALLVDVSRKDRVIQHYALREETGSVSTEQSDDIKRQLSRKGGSAMGSVFSAHHDGTMTLDLSLEINRKLQALLEDTLLKNMTLKDNMETLGEEIANLSRNNRELHMELQIYKKISGNGS